MSQIFDHSRSSGTDRLTLLALADHANDDGECWPGQARLARKTNMTARSVQRCIANLVKLGEVEVIRHGTGTTTSLYRITPTASVTPDAQRTPTASVTPTRSVRRGVPPVSGGGVPPVSTKPSIEPSINHQVPSKPFESDFAELLNVYRKKDDKAKARTAYQARRRDGVKHEDLMRSAISYLETKKDSEPKFIKSLAVFLNGAEGPWSEYLNSPSTPTIAACPECHCIGNHPPDCSLKGS